MQALRARLASLDGGAGTDSTRRVVVPVIGGLVGLCVLLLLVVSQCAVEVVSPGGDTAGVPTVDVATPSFSRPVQTGCVPVGDNTLAEIGDSMLEVRHHIGQSASYTSEDGEFIAVSILWDDRRVAVPSAIFVRDDDGRLWSVSAAARRLTLIPDGRNTVTVSPVTPGALAAQNCIS